MSWAKTGCVLVLAVVLLAGALRVPHLARRPMHTDEAVHADRYRLLLDGQYRYDPTEYHGPTLNYLTLIPALLSGAGFSYAQITETTLRIVPVFFGVLMVALVWLIARDTGSAAAVMAALLTAVSPVMVFYSRYYIQEMLLVAFTFGLIACGWRYVREGRLFWAMAAGVFAGLMYATKETCIIAFGSMGVALLAVLLIQQRRQSLAELTGGIRGRHAAAALGLAGIVVVLFYSSFLTYPRGVLDSLLTFQTYFDRAGGGVAHHHPWYYYLKLLAGYRFADGPVFSEGLILVLAVVGTVGVLWNRCRALHPDLGRFLVVYSWTMAVIYSLIPYKTPWCLLGFYHGMILLAGIGMAWLLSLGPRGVRVVWLILLVGGAAHLGRQAYLAAYVYDADSRNPWVYAHTSRNVFVIVDEVNKIAAADPAGRDMDIQVIVPENDYWPLPWYLRSFGNVSYDTMVRNAVPAAPLIIAKYPDVDAALRHKLYVLPPPGQKEMYMTLFEVELRPQLTLRGYVSYSAWQRFEYSDTTDVEAVLNTDRKASDGSQGDGP